MKQFAAKLTDSQLKLARAFESAGITTYSQAIKAFERHNDAQIAEWKRALAEKRAQQN